MNIDNLKRKWQKSFDESCSSVENYLFARKEDDSDSANFRQLAKWLIETPYSAYDFMPMGYQNFRSSPFGTESLLGTLHHALVDDGEVSFVKMIIEGKVERVFMIFVWQNEDSFNSLCQLENQSFINSFIAGRESLQRVMSSMQEKHPEKTLNVKPLISEKDVTFEAHRDPLKFIKEVEDFQLQKKKVVEENAKLESKIKSRKP